MVRAVRSSRIAWFVCSALAAIAPGCAFAPHDHVPTELLRDRILPPADVETTSLPTPGQLPSNTERPRDRPGFTVEGCALSQHATAGDWAPPAALTLEEAIELAFRASPSLELMDQRIAQAEAGRTIAFADFLPQTTASYRPIDGSTPFVLPTLPTYVGNVALPDSAQRFGLAELNVQWILWDFGRTTGRYGQAATQVDIARLQYERARQTVAFNVTAAYLQVLQARAMRVVAEEAVRRADAVLRDARNFLKRGTGIRNDVWRADVLLAEMRLNQVKAHTAERIAVAALNEAIGINVSSPTQVVERVLEPHFSLDLAQSLQLAADHREEFGVVLRSIGSAQLGTGIAQADFLPKVLAGAVGIHADTNEVKSANLAAVGLNIEWPLFQGGRRIGKLQNAEAEVRAAIAQGKEVCDKIAFEVQTAYVLIDDARERIALARTAVSGATENLRVVRSRFDKGDATPTDVVDGELAMTRGQQAYYTALYDYETGLARLAYAVGLPVLSDFSATGGTCHE